MQKMELKIQKNNEEKESSYKPALLSIPEYDLHDQDAYGYWIDSILDEEKEINRINWLKYICFIGCFVGILIFTIKSQVLAFACVIFYTYEFILAQNLKWNNTSFFVFFGGIFLSTVCRNAYAIALHRTIPTKYQSRIKLPKVILFQLVLFPISDFISSYNIYFWPRLQKLYCIDLNYQPFYNCYEFNRYMLFLLEKSKPIGNKIKCFRYQSILLYIFNIRMLQFYKNKIKYNNSNRYGSSCNDLTDIPTPQSMLDLVNMNKDYINCTVDDINDLENPNQILEKTHPIRKQMYKFRYLWYSCHVIVFVFWTLFFFVTLAVPERNNKFAVHLYPLSDWQSHIEKRLIDVGLYVIYFILIRYISNDYYKGWDHDLIFDVELMHYVSTNMKLRTPHSPALHSMNLKMKARESFVKVFYDSETIELVRNFVAADDKSELDSCLEKIDSFLYGTNVFVDTDYRPLTIGDINPEFRNRFLQ